MGAGGFELLWAQAAAFSPLSTVVQDQDSKLKQSATEIDRLMDRVRSEAAQKVELQEELFEARALYASVVADREAMEARTARAEAERAAADNHYTRAKEQVWQGAVAAGTSAS
jgi:septal ring factor EnvC (AmiA/AmiB activator)